MMMRNLTNKKDWYDSHTFRVMSPEGTLFVTVTVDHSNEPFMLKVFGIKNASPLHIWIEALSNLINEMWKCGIHTSTIIRLLDTQYGPRYITNDGGVKVYSGPGAIQWALIQFLQVKNNGVGVRVG